MTQQQYIIRRKLNIIELAEQLGNISEACRKLGVSRQHYYDIKAALEEEGIGGLLEKARNKARINNRVAPEIEEPVWSMMNFSAGFIHGEEVFHNNVVLGLSGRMPLLRLDVRLARL